MKLLYKTTRDFLAITVVIILLAGLGLYFILKNEVSEEMNEQLTVQSNFLEHQAESGTISNHPFASILPIEKIVLDSAQFGDTSIYDPVQNKFEDFRFLKKDILVQGKAYRTTVMTAHIGWESYYTTIFGILIISIVTFAGAVVVAVYVSNKKIWSSFFTNLKQMQLFSLSRTKELNFENSNIDEFKQLQKVLTEVTTRSNKEYTALREFTENASHEIQTPLGIVQSKLNRLSQMDINEEMAGHIAQAQSGIERLSKLNKDLLLLAKLDNNAFTSREQVNVNKRITDFVENMNELFSTKRIEVSLQLNELIEVNSDPYLVDTLIANLLSNAYKYTSVEGKIIVSSSAQKIIFSNDGSPLDFPPELLFNRFQKSAMNRESTGLGLAIVKQICEINHWNIEHGYADGKHYFEISFSE